MKQGTLSRQKMKETEKSIVDDISESDEAIRKSERQSVRSRGQQSSAKTMKESNASPLKKKKKTMGIEEAPV
jgi:hypothetical protein